MTDIDLQTLARYAVICIAGGLMIGYGMAWVLSTPVITTHYELGAGVLDPVQIVAVEVHTFTPVLGFEILMIMVATGALIGVVLRYVPAMVMEWMEEEDDGEA